MHTLISGVPLVVTLPQNLIVLSDFNQNITFTCGAITDPPQSPLIWLWVFNSNMYLLGTNDTSESSKYSINRNMDSQQFGSLTVYDIVYEDRGVYQCIAVNSAGRDNVNSTLTVHGICIHVCYIVLVHLSVTKILSASCT